MSKNKKKQQGVVKSEPPISFFNWFITLIFSFIPGANLLFFIITIPCARTQTKRNFAIAGLVLTLILFIAAYTLIAIYLEEIGDAIANWAKSAS